MNPHADTDRKEKNKLFTHCCVQLGHFSLLDLLLGGLGYLAGVSVCTDQLLQVLSFLLPFLLASLNLAQLIDKLLLLLNLRQSEAKSVMGTTTVTLP